MIHLDTAIRFSFRPRDCRCQPDRRVLLETNSAECRPLASKQMRQDRRRSERDAGPDADISATPADLTPIRLPFFRYLLQAIECLTDTDWSVARATMASRSATLPFAAN